MKLEETFAVNPPDGKPQPEIETGEQVPLSSPWLPLAGENTNASKAGNRVHRPADRSEHEKVPYGQRQGLSIVYKHGVLHRDPESEGEGKVSHRLTVWTRTELQINRNRTLDLDIAVMTLLEEMTKLNIALKAWRSPVSDALNDGRFFSSSSAAGKRWRPIVRALVGTDKSAFMEILGFRFFIFDRNMTITTISYRKDHDGTVYKHFQ